MWRVVIIGLLFALHTAAETPGTNRLVIASWNVENLFDPDNDPANPGAVDFTPDGWERWTSARYALKLDHLAEVIAAMRPDVLCLSEIENRRVLEDLVRILRLRRHYELPVILHREGQDPRGIDVAMLARFAPVATNWITPVPQMRDILIARFVVGGRPLTVFANHWKSWAGTSDENVRIRTIEAKAALAEIRRRLNADPSCALIAAGDFNDNVDSDVMTNAASFVLGLPSDKHPARAGSLYNLSALLPPTDRGTFYYGMDRVWNSFDSMSVSRGMLPGARQPSAWLVATNQYGLFVLPQQRDKKGRPLSFRRVRKKDETGRMGDAYIAGYSDHFPMRCVLEAAAP